MTQQEMTTLMSDRDAPEGPLTQEQLDRVKEVALARKARQAPTARSASKPRVRLCLKKLSLRADHASPSSSASTDRTTFACTREKGHGGQHSCTGYVFSSTGSQRFDMTWFDNTKPEAVQVNSGVPRFIQRTQG